jgi:hypothetical protein
MNTIWYPKTSFHDADHVPSVFEFESTADLFALEIVRQANKIGAEFVLDGDHLLVLYKDGFEWWVVGRISQPNKVNLPKWGGPKVRVRLDNGLETVVNKEIHSMCGNRVTLRDGSVAIKIEEKFNG